MTTLIPTRETIADRLLNLPAEIAAAQRMLVAARAEVLERKREYDHAKWDILTAEGVLGKNEEERKARMGRLLASRQEAIDNAERAVWLMTIEVEQLQAEFSAYRNLAKMLGGTVI